MEPRTGFAEAPSWHPERPRIRPVRLVLSWLVSALALSSPPRSCRAQSRGLLGRAGRGRRDRGAERVPAAAHRSPAAAVDARARVPARPVPRRPHAPARRLDHRRRDPASTRSGGRCSRRSSPPRSRVVLEVVLGTNDDDTYTLRVIQRIARRSGERVETDVPGIIFLEIDGLGAARSCSARCATATRRPWPAGSPRTRTGSPSGRPTSPRRPGRARPASCSARTRTSPPSAGSRRRPAR